MDDLEKKLFSKLDAYEAVSRKRGKERGKGGKGEKERGMEGEGYERIQKRKCKMTQ